MLIKSQVLSFGTEWRWVGNVVMIIGRFWFEDKEDDIWELDAGVDNVDEDEAELD